MSEVPDSRTGDEPLVPTLILLLFVVIGTGVVLIGLFSEGDCGTLTFEPRPHQPEITEDREE